MRSVGWAIATVVVASLAIGISSASGAPLQCGDVVTQDTTLSTDLVDCPGDGLVIGADDVKLDLNGHTIDGDNQAANFPGDQGVNISGGFDRVRVVNGTVQQFDSGVRLDRSDDSRIEQLTSSANHIGLNILDSAGDVVLDTVLTANLGDGLRLSHGDQASIRGNRVDGNGIGIDSLNSSRDAIDRNVITHNLAGLDLRGGCDDNQLTRNTVTDNQHAGITVIGDDNVVSANTAARNEQGVVVIGDRTLLTRNAASNNRDSGFFVFVSKHTSLVANVASNNSDTGIDLRPGFNDGSRVERNRTNTNGLDGIAVEDSKDVTIVANVSSGNGTRHPGITGVGILIFSADDASVTRNTTRANGFAGIDVRGAARTSLLKNVSRDNLVDGIGIDSSSSGSVLQSNSADANGDDGIDVNSPAATLTANVANDNVDLGIEAEPGVTDGGKNKASGNGNPAQCLNVSCS
jgi:parallel beta-helix repeat protein